MTDVAVWCQDVEIKHQSHSLSYAFVQFDNIHSVVSALHEMDSEQIGLNKIKVTVKSPALYTESILSRLWPVLIHGQGGL